MRVAAVGFCRTIVVLGVILRFSSVYMRAHRMAGVGRRVWVKPIRGGVDLGISHWIIHNVPVGFLEGTVLRRMVWFWFGCVCNGLVCEET